MQEMTSLLGEPLPVEFLIDDDWRPAVLLGWAHEPDGTCWVRVQAVVGGLRRASWVHLADLRLPRPDRAAPEPRTRPDLQLPGRGQPRRTPTPLPPLPVPRSLQPDSSWA
ncbi:hypothetical protein O2V63_02735 [Modestobacter sp. VKM Ac-2977]|uniref:hypothetical protein n=1 Tax=Modestobacter sp. VKM Ac-2977 TaxID=3004131 RepID=UPI0022A9FA2A|nr:hypothetical protein [Modestobacter sp. VKM Ac-2977]MCZ2819242.1 hypothetical protein [Modestobacter sp. VKM Ac-2977]